MVKLILGFLSLSALMSGSALEPADSEAPSVESEASVVSVAENDAYAYGISFAASYYSADDDDKTIYTLNDTEGNPLYALSQDGWSEEETEPIVCTLRETFAPLEISDKYVYAYIYKVENVVWNGVVIAPIEGYELAYELAKPATEGIHALTVSFVKTLLSVKDLTSVDWLSLFTVPNLLALLGILLPSAFGLIMFIWNRKIKSQNFMTLSSFKKEIFDFISGTLGVEFATKVDELIGDTFKKTFNDIDAKITNSNQSVQTMVRCLMLMAEGSADSRAAALKELSHLQVNDEDMATKLLAMIEDKQNKAKAEKLEKEKALAAAKATNEKYLASIPATEVKKADSDDDGGIDDGTKI